MHGNGPWLRVGEKIASSSRRRSEACTSTAIRRAATETTAKKGERRVKEARTATTEAANYPCSAAGGTEGPQGDADERNGVNYSCQGSLSTGNIGSQYSWPIRNVLPLLPLFDPHK